MDENEIEVYIATGDGGIGNEWVVPLGGGMFRLTENSFMLSEPGHDEPLSKGDVIEVAPLEEGAFAGEYDRARCYTFVRVIERSPLVRSTHMVSRQMVMYADWDALDRTVLSAGGSWDRAFGGVLTLNLPREGAFELDAAWQALVESAAEREAHVRTALQRDVEFLAAIVGERNLDKLDRLRQAADWLAAGLVEAGLVVRRLPFEVDGRTVENIEAVLPGTTAADEVIVVGAHYDTVWDTPGADDNATGVAVLLLIAREVSRRPFARTLRFVGFVNEEPPYFHTEAMGSLVYARACKARGDRIVGMLSLESLGYYTDEAGSQRYPDPALVTRFGDKGNFLALVADESSAGLLKDVRTAFNAATGAPSLARDYVGDARGIGWSDHWSFWEVGYPAVMATDTAPFRNPHYHMPTDLPDTLDYERLAIAAVGLRGAVEALVG